MLLKTTRVAQSARLLAVLVAAVTLPLSAGSAPALAQQSLDDAVGQAVNNNCANLGPRRGPQLTDLCNSIPGFNAVAIPGTGTPAAQSDLSGLDPESRVRRRLEERRDQKKNSQTGMNGAPDSNDMTFSLGGLSGFATLAYERQNKDTTGLEDGYESNKYGVTAGVDHNFGSFVGGVAIDYSKTNADFASTGGGGFDTDSYGALVYASFTPVQAAYLDLSAGYARKDFEIDRFISFSNNGNAFTTSGIASGNTNGNEYRAGATGGYDFNFQRFTVGPRLALNYVHTSVDAFSEAGSTGLEVAFDSHSVTSFTSALGVHGSAAYSTSFGVIVPQVSFDYIHEFANGQETLTGHLVQDLNANPFRLAFQNDSPDRDYFGVGAGVVLVLPEGFTTFANYRGIVGNSLVETHTFSVGLRKEF